MIQENTGYTLQVTSTDRKVGYLLEGKGESGCTPEEAEEALKLLEGRWKMIIVFRLFERPTMRFSELERGIPGVSQKMLIQQLRELERVGIVGRTVYPVVPPKVEYFLTEHGLGLYPVLDALLKWAKGAKQEEVSEASSVAV